MFTRHPSMTNQEIDSVLPDTFKPALKESATGVTANIHVVTGFHPDERCCSPAPTANRVPVVQVAPAFEDSMHRRPAFQRSPSKAAERPRRLPSQHTTNSDCS